MVYNYHNLMKLASLQPFSPSPSARIAMEIVVILLSVSILSSPPLRAEETAEEITEKESFASVARSFFDKAVGATKSLFKEEEVEEDTTPAVDPDELAREAALATAKEAIVLAEGGYHFTQSRWGAIPTPHQIDGLELIPLSEGTLNETDIAAGIDRRATYEFRATNWRKFHEQTGWGRWTKGVPPHLESITLVREKGAWKVAVSPLWAYSLK